MPKKILFLITLSISLSAWGFDHTHKQWNSIVSKFVALKKHSSTFNYAGMKKEVKDLDAYLAVLAKVKKEEFKRFSYDQRLAFLINLYNAATVKLVVDNFPIKSIKDATFLSPFSKDFFYLFGAEISLNHLEHDIIRTNYKDSRIHFALNCASVGCPALQNKAFTEKNLSKLLEEGKVSFLKDRSRNKFFPKKKMLKLSKIFDWYKGDFLREKKTLKDYVVDYLADSPDQKKKILSKSTAIDFFDYDWNLNK